MTAKKKYIYIINPIGNTSSAVLFVSYKNCHQGFINLRQKALAQSSHQKWKTCSVCPALGVPRAAETAGNASLTPLLPRGAPAEPPHVLGCTRRHWMSDTISYNAICKTLLGKCSTATRGTPFSHWLSGYRAILNIQYLLSLTSLDLFGRLTLSCPSAQKDKKKTSDFT